MPCVPLDFGAQVFNIRDGRINPFPSIFLTGGKAFYEGFLYYKSLHLTSETVHLEASREMSILSVLSTSW